MHRNGVKTQVVDGSTFDGSIVRSPAKANVLSLGWSGLLKFAWCGHVSPPNICDQESAGLFAPHEAPSDHSDE